MIRLARYQCLVANHEPSVTFAGSCSMSPNEGFSNRRDRPSQRKRFFFVFGHRLAALPQKSFSFTPGFSPVERHAPQSSTGPKPGVNETTFEALPRLAIVCELG